MINSYNEISNVMDKVREVDIVLYFIRAFDTTHWNLIEKLLNYMLDKLTVKWIVKLAKTDTESIGQWCKKCSQRPVTSRVSDQYRAQFCLSCSLMF